MKGWFRKVSLLYRRLGLKGLLARLLRLAVAPVYTKKTELLVVKRLDKRNRARPSPPKFQIHPVSTTHVDRLRQFNERHRTRNDVRASTCYLRNGYDGFLAFLDDELIGYWWWVSNRTDPALTHPGVERFELNLSDDEVFAFDYFIAPDCRGQGAAVKVLSLIYGELARRGYTKVWGAVDAENVPARWVYKVHGNTVVSRHVSRELLSSFLWQSRRVFLKNTKWNQRHSFEGRLLVSLKSRNGGRSGHGEVA